ncbi:cupin domain-containing protein [Lysinibacillus sp. NPDC047702]|uniref:cupin domain-containing protein n=1 Tax=unclassified Lysinibacillus TaxID=2636778 RepID=UPI003D0306DA
MSLFSTASNVTLSQAGKGLRIAGEQKNWVIEPIFQTTINGIEMYRAYLQPHSLYQPEKHHPDTTEIVTVMRGTITMQVNDISYTLNRYDSINFKADGIHTYINNSESLVVLHIVLKYGI